MVGYQGRGTRGSVSGCDLNERCDLHVSTNGHGHYKAVILNIIIHVCSCTLSLIFFICFIYQHLYNYAFVS